MSFKEGWKEYKLGEVAEIKYGKDHKHLADGNIPVYGSGGIMRYANKALYEKPSILIPRKGTLSNLFYITKPFWSVDTMFYTKIKENVDSQFLFYLIKTLDLASMNVGSAVPSLTTEILNKIEILLPDFELQRRIAKILSGLDEKIELNRQMNQTLEETAQTLFREMCLPKGDELPEGWEETGIGAIAAVQNGFAFKSNDFIENGTSGIIKIRNINSNVVDIQNTQFVSKEVANKVDRNRFLISSGDLLIAMTGAEVGKIGLIPKTEKELWLNQRVGCFKEKVKFANYFLYLLLSTDEYQSILRNSAMGSAQPNISASAIEEIKTIIPPIQVIEDFGIVVQPLFVKMLENYAENEILAETRDNLLPKLMTGEIDVENIKIGIK